MFTPPVHRWTLTQTILSGKDDCAVKMLEQAFIMGHPIASQMLRHDAGKKIYIYIQYIHYRSNVLENLLLQGFFFIFTMFYIIVKTSTL
jgi:hypothetical protein